MCFLHISSFIQHFVHIFGVSLHFIGDIFSLMAWLLFHLLSQVSVHIPHTFFDFHFASNLFLLHFSNFEYSFLPNIQILIFLIILNFFIVFLFLHKNVIVLVKSLYRYHILCFPRKKGLFDIFTKL